MCPNIRKWGSLEYYTLAVKDGINLDKLKISSFCLLAGKRKILLDFLLPY